MDFLDLANINPLAARQVRARSSDLGPLLCNPPLDQKVATQAFAGLGVGPIRH